MHKKISRESWTLYASMIIVMLVIAASGFALYRYYKSHQVKQAGDQPIVSTSLPTETEPPIPTIPPTTSEIQPEPVQLPSEQQILQNEPEKTPAAGPKEIEQPAIGLTAQR